MSNFPRLLIAAATGLVLSHTALADDSAAKADAVKIAEKAGLSKWEAITNIKFTFNVNRGDTKIQRTWTWAPKTHIVTSIQAGKEPVTYDQSKITEDFKDLDSKFINDQYWLLFPYHLVWDTGVTFTKAAEKAPAPISGEPMNMLTATYPKEGGYTPGDSYDIFYDDDFNLHGWNFHKGGAEKPSLTTTWENWKDFDGIKISLDRNTPSGDKFSFTDVSVKTAE